MDKKNTANMIIMAAIAAVCGFLGGMSAPMFQGTPEDVTFKTVTVTEQLDVMTPGQPEGEEKGCRLLPNGTVTATEGVLANQVKGGMIMANQVRSPQVVSQSFLAMTNPTGSDPNTQRVCIEMAASPKTGGAILIRDGASSFNPTTGGNVNIGQTTFLGYDQQSGGPAMYRRDLAAGNNGLTVFVPHKATFTPNGQQAEADTQPGIPGTQPSGATAEMAYQQPTLSPQTTQPPYSPPLAPTGTPGDTGDRFARQPGTDPGPSLR